MAIYITTIREAAEEIALLYKDIYKDSFEFSEPQVNVIKKILEPWQAFSRFEENIN
ncbi:MAG: hypothetical protein LBT24_05805 [Tannerella sp.]|jgi:hypothetical protein|nr:hypothetical protein [Tannerella sp.]